MVVLPKASSAVTVTLWAVPAVVGLGYPDTARTVVAPGSTVIPLWVPVMVPVTVSVAVIDCVPTVLSVTALVKVCVPASAPVKV